MRSGVALGTAHNDTNEGEEMRVRVGINAGEPIAENDDLFGLSVTLAARIGSCCWARSSSSPRSARRS